jgi:hypothetical protein
VNDIPVPDQSALGVDGELTSNRPIRVTIDESARSTFDCCEDNWKNFLFIFSQNPFVNIVRRIMVANIIGIEIMIFFMFILVSFFKFHFQV